jgi:hypothetical protein
VVAGGVIYVVARWELGVELRKGRRCGNKREESSRSLLIRL